MESLLASYCISGLNTKISAAQINGYKHSLSLNCLQYKYHPVARSYI